MPPTAAGMKVLLVAAILCSSNILSTHGGKKKLAEHYSYAPMSKACFRLSHATEPNLCHKSSFYFWTQACEFSCDQQGELQLENCNECNDTTTIQPDCDDLICILDHGNIGGDYDDWEPEPTDPVSEPEPVGHPAPGDPELPTSVEPEPTEDTTYPPEVITESSPEPSVTSEPTAPGDPELPTSVDPEPTKDTTYPPEVITEISPEPSVTPEPPAPVDPEPTKDTTYPPELITEISPEPSVTPEPSAAPVEPEPTNYTTYPPEVITEISTEPSVTPEPSASPVNSTIHCGVSTTEAIVEN